MEWLNNFGSLINDNIWLALIMSLVAGIVSSFSPCVLSSIPLIVGYVEKNGVKDKKIAFKFSIFFSLGVMVTFTLLGVLSALLGKFFSGGGGAWYLFLSFIMILSGLQILGVINIGPKDNSCRLPSLRKGLFGAFLLGILGGILSSPCATPVLAAILSFVAGKANIGLGIAMLILYSIGHSVLIILSGTSIGLIESLSSSPKTKKIGQGFKIVLGIIVIVLGIYLFSYAI